MLTTGFVKRKRLKFFRGISFRIPVLSFYLFGKDNNPRTPGHLSDALAVGFLNVPTPPL